MGIFSKLVTEAFAPDIVRDAFVKVGLWPWNPNLIRQLCLIHCPSLSQLNGTSVLRKLESIMKGLEAQQEAERDEIIAIVRRASFGSKEETEVYQLRGRTVARPHAHDDE